MDDPIFKNYVKEYCLINYQMSEMGVDLVTATVDVLLSMCPSEFLPLLSKMSAIKECSDVQPSLFKHGVVFALRSPSDSTPWLDVSSKGSSFPLM